MEEAYKARIKIIESYLSGIILEATELIKRSNTSGANVDEVIKIKIKLKQAIDRFSSDVNRFMDKTSNPSDEFITSSTAKQFEADNVLASVETLLTVHMAAESQGVTNFQHSKLPTLPPPKFSGDILMFHQFWDQFSATIDKIKLEDVDKLAYLMASLQGKALEAINGLDISNKNYVIAVETLKRQFGKKDHLVDAHHEAVKNLPPALSQDDCRHTLNSIEHHLRILETLGENVDDNHFRTTIKSKFPKSTVRELNMILQPSQNTVPEIRKALDHIITASEDPNLQVTKGPVESQIESSSMALMQVGQRETRKINMQSGQSSVAKKRKDPISPELTKKKSKLSCIFCSEDHYNNECTRFKTVADRKKKLGKRCFRCLRTGHFAESCKMRKLCYMCKGNHHQALCPKTGKEIVHNNEMSQVSCHVNNTMSILQTATVKVNRNNNQMKCRLLLDSGSQRSYITTKIANKMKLTADKEDLLIIFTFGSDTPQETSSPSVEIDIETKRGITRRIRVNIVPLITERIPVSEHALNLELDIMADDNSIGEGIDMLIGNDYYVSFMRNKNIKIQDCLFLIDTDFGWVLTGSLDVPEERVNSLSVITYCQCYDPERLYFTVPDLPLRDKDMKFLWALESIGITDSAKTSREDEAVKHFNETVTYENGRYQVKWPWVEYPPDIPTNFGLAYGRLKSVLLRLNEETLKEYESILQVQLLNGIIEIIDPSTVNADKPKRPIHYLAHHLVKAKGKDGRIVYDASARVRDQRSLNETLYKGPSMLEDLTILLIKFRTGKIGITADVEKAFLQVGLQEADRDVTRFLHMRFCRVPFGIISSPFLLTATIRHHLASTNKELLPKVADKCYVDNLVTSTATTSTAYMLYCDTRKSFQELSMNIRDWASNDKAFIQKIPEELRAKDTKVAKVLGVIWNLQDDSLQLKLNEQVFNEASKKGKMSKRGVLRTLASFYDPCGFFSPLVLPAKILMQELWKIKLSWDAPLPEHLVARWTNIVNSMQTAKDIQLPRYVGKECRANEKVVHELHCFTDASKHAHAAVVYLRTTNEQGSKTAILMSKSRVNPVKESEDLKIPRLELLGYVIGNRLLSYVRDALDIPVTKQVLWTDSLVVLCWMKSDKLLPPFVARRVNEIKQNPKLTTRYINTEQNPADLATRPELWTQKRSLWFQGPEFLTDNNAPWPNENQPEIQYSTFSLAAEGLEAENPERNTVRTNENIVQVESNSEGCIEKETTNLQLQEIVKLQNEHFKEEMMGKVTHLSRNLGLFLDVDGLLRCRGRVSHTDWSYEMKHPILLPKDSDYTTKIIKETHEKNYHVGVTHTLSIIRQRYWIPQGRAQIQKVLKKCPQCVKHGGGPYALPPTPALPPERVTYSHPFTYTGIDYFGPMYVNTPQGKRKRWICLLTCLVVRAIHLEVVNDLTAQECLLALRRFVASRGLPTMIVSDNALQFKLTSEVLEDTYCSQNNIKWKFIPELAPWHGGVYERMVSLVKHCLKRTLEKHLLIDSQLVTVIKEVENVCNTRPLTYVGTEQEHILRPADFLSLGKCLVIEQEDDHTPTVGTSTKRNLIDGWKRGQRIMSEFKTMFIGQYLPSLRERYHHSYKQSRVKSRRVPRVGDMVQLKDSAKNRENWKVGKIISLVEGLDGECRVAKVKVGDSQFTRSIAHLYPLEAEILDFNKSEKSTVEIPESTPHDRTQLFGHDMHEQTLIPESENTISEVPGKSGCRRTSPINFFLDEVNVEENLHPTPEGEVDIDPRQDPASRDANGSSTENLQEVKGRSKREAAIKAREKIAEWTQLLFAMLK